MQYQLQGVLWTTGDIERLTALWHAGEPASAIVATLSRSANSVRIRASKMRLLRCEAQGSKAGVRPCMCCERPFYREGIHNRLCAPCIDGAH